MPKWIHDRAEHIMSKSPGTKKSTAFAVATQQAEAQGKDPSGFGTPEGHRAAKRKYDKASSQYEQQADPGSEGKRKESVAINSILLHGFTDEFTKIAENPQHEAGKRGAAHGATRGAAAGSVFGAIAGSASKIGKHVARRGFQRTQDALKNNPKRMIRALRGSSLKGAVAGLGAGALLGAAKGYRRGRELHHIVMGNKEKTSGLSPTGPTTVSAMTRTAPKLSPSLAQRKASYSKPSMELPAMRPGLQNTLPPPIATAAGAL